MNRIPIQRFAGRVTAYGAYGLPSASDIRIPRRLALVFAVVAALLLLRALGVFDDHGLLILAAGPTVTQLADTYEGQAKALKAYMDEHQKDGVYDLDAEGVKKVREMNADLNKAHDEWQAAKELGDIADGAVGALKRTKEGRPIADRSPDDTARAQVAIKALIEESAEKGGLKEVRDAGNFKGTKTLFELDDPEETEAFLQGAKTTITLTQMAPQNAARSRVVESVQNRIVVSDLMADGTTDSNTLPYLEETTFTNAAAETAENTAKPESALAWTERTDTVRKIATWIPVTDEALADNAQLRSIVENRLTYMVRQREEQQLISGNGTPPNIQGVINRSGIQTQAKGADPVLDAFFKAMVKVGVTGDADVDGFVIHPTDWQGVRLLRTADGIYILGNPADDVPVRLWGQPGRVTTGITVGTGLVGAFRTYAQVFRRSGLAVVASTEHASFFIENRIALLAETRLALAVYRPAAFCTVTGL